MSLLGPLHLDGGIVHIKSFELLLGIFFSITASTKEVILGNDNGQLHEMAVDEKDKKEKYVKFLFELLELPEAFMSLQTVFASYLDHVVHFMELPGEIPNRQVCLLTLINELHFYIKQRRAVHFAWLSGAGIYHGGLNFGAQHSSPNGDENFVENKALLNYSILSEGAELVKPSSMTVSEFHFLLLIGNKVKVVNRISEQIIEELQFDQTPESVSRGVIGLCSDATAGLFYAYDQNSVFQVSVNDEGRDMWKVSLDMKEYAAALANCRDPLQRDQAEAAFASKDYLRAASFYAKDDFPHAKSSHLDGDKVVTVSDGVSDMLLKRQWWKRKGIFPQIK
ncbi:hypothetical protein ACE6H2_009616 [Prunus campanulata]